MHIHVVIRKNDEGSSRTYFVWSLQILRRLKRFVQRPFLTTAWPSLHNHRIAQMLQVLKRVDLVMYNNCQGIDWVELSGNFKTNVQLIALPNYYKRTPEHLRCNASIIKYYFLLNVKMFISIRKPHFGNKAYFASIRNNKSNGLSSRTSNNLYGCGKRIMMDLGMTVSCAFLCQHVSYWNTTDSSLNFLNG